MEIGVFDPKEIIELIAEEVGRNTYEDDSGLWSVFARR
jgi:hypothetical protein